MKQKPRAGTASATLRKQAEQEREELRTLSRRVVEAQENERRAIARELHNVVGQSMTVLKLMLDKAMHSPAKSIAPTLAEARAVVDEVVTRIRDLSLELVPSVLDDLGLLPTLLWYCQRFGTQTGVQVNFSHKGLDRSFPPEVSIAAYRIVQEALANVAHHAEVSEATMRAWTDDKTLFLQIEDRGTGFDPVEVSAGDYSGIRGMKERALYLGGKLSIESARGNGTSVTAELPLAPPKREGG